MRNAALAGLLLLAGCGGQWGDQPQFSPRFVPLMQADAPQLQVRFMETGLNSTLLLAQNRDGVQTWLAADGAGILVEDGMVMGTRGVGQGLLAVEASATRRAIRARRAGVITERFHTYLLGDDTTRTRTYQCLIETRGAANVLTENGNVPALLWAESCNSLDQSFVNLYWINPTTSRVIQSRQWIGDFSGEILLRPRV
ncbi:YjbF family lipoprotein [Aestuariibius sp. HNIBRBA575]|uniref:YjbF family lipoprotein n=1 Tax=Aestuariibius sp. HNIBRBA575 TaxID=3233343 RepID=UPI0034A1FC69